MISGMCLNLARRLHPEARMVDPEVQAQVRAELEQAGIKCTEMDFLLETSGEVPTSIIGTAYRWTFRRAWRYWVATGPGIPQEIAEPFHNKWGKVVRTGGFAGGRSPLEHAEGFAIDSYHIDTMEGLEEFVHLLFTIHKPRS